jgi:hypothetical protein
MWGGRGGIAGSGGSGNVWVFERSFISFPKEFKFNER